MHSNLETVECFRAFPVCECVFAPGKLQHDLRKLPAAPVESQKTVTWHLQS